MRPVKPEAILLIGGFGQSNYLRESIREALATDNIHVSQPPNGSAANAIEFFRIF